MAGLTKEQRAQRAAEQTTGICTIPKRKEHGRDVKSGILH